MFACRTKGKGTKKLYINGMEIPFLDQVGYLGITLNKRLTWDNHINSKINRSKGKLMKLRASMGVLWGPTPKAMIWAFNSIIVPSLTYGALVWGHNKPTVRTQISLSKLNRLISLSLALFRKSTPMAGLEVILGLKPLDLVIQEAGYAAFMRWNPRLKWTGASATATQLDSSSNGPKQGGHGGFTPHP